MKKPELFLVLSQMILLAYNEGAVTLESGMLEHRFEAVKRKILFIKAMFTIGNLWGRGISPFWAFQITSVLVFSLI